MENLIASIARDNPQLIFVKGGLLCWSPETKQISYDPEGGKEGVFGVLHEVGHALLKHESYTSDVDLLKKEALAWEEAANQAKRYGITLNWEHIQDCLDSYRDWLHKRSTCPACQAHGVQRTPRIYHCLNCGAEWRVAESRFCRPYRLPLRGINPK